PSASIHVHKFGGTSLADAARIRALGALLDDGAGSRLVVVSAMHGTTNALVELAATARNGGDWLPAWEALRQRHLQAADALGSNACHTSGRCRPHRGPHPRIRRGLVVAPGAGGTRRRRRGLEAHRRA